MLTLSVINLGQNTNSKPTVSNQKKTLIKIHSQPQKDAVSFSGFSLPKRKIERIIDPAIIEKRLKAFENLFGVPIECQEKSIFYEHGSYFQSKQKYSLIDIKKIYQKACKSLKEEELKLKAYKSENQIGEFANALYEFELKSQYRGNKHKGLKFEFPREGLIRKRLNANKTKNKNETHFSFYSLNEKYQEIYKDGLVHKKFISKEMDEIINQKAKNKHFNVTYNETNYELRTSGDTIQILKIS